MAPDLPAARTGGLLAAVRSLVTPLHFAPRPPTMAAVPFAPARRGIAARADVYLPSTGTGWPSVVLVHGGAFVVGSRAMKPMRHLTTRLAAAGIAVASIDYRMLGRGGRLAEAVADVEAAVRWWRGFGARLGAAPARLSLMGLSAGGTAAMLAAPAVGDAVHRLVDVFGVADFAALRGKRAMLVRRLLGADRLPTPLDAVTQVAAPTLIVHGTADAMVPYAHAEALAAARRTRGLPTELVPIAGAPHGFFNTAATAAAADAALAAIVPFLGGAAP